MTVIVMKKYILINHTADLALRIFGKDPAELFSNAAFALFDMITDSSPQGEKEMEIRVSGEDMPDLMFHWLRELLYLWNGRGFLLCGSRISAISAQELQATVRLAHYNPAHHRIKEEIKAVTYHCLSVEQKNSEWVAEVVLDV